jgi:transcriptional regulator with XRE-family HTH domain
MHEKLTNFRKAKGISQKEMAQKIAMEQTTYSRKERGISPITDNEWERLAKALEVDIDEIREEKPIAMKNENCTFHENSIGNQYVNIPQQMLETLMKYTKLLEDKIEELKKK